MDFNQMLIVALAISNMIIVYTSIKVDKSKKIYFDKYVKEVQKHTKTLGELNTATRLNLKQTNYIIELEKRRSDKL